MSQEHVEIVRGAVDAWNRRDRAAAAAVLHPDIEFQTILGPVLGVERVRGGEAVLRFLFEELPDGFDALGAVVEELADLGNGRVLLVATYRGRGKASGLEIDTRVSSLYRLSGDLIASVRDYADTQQALQAVGLSE